MEKNKVAILTFTDGGLKIAEKLEGKLYFNKEKKIKPEMQIIMDTYDLIIFISAVGIAVRYIKDYIRSKTVDPAVIVIDEAGRFTIPILSGHIGGANEYARTLAEQLGSIAVVTTASDLYEMEAIDLFAEKHNLYIENFDKIPYVMGRMVEKKPVYIYNDTEYLFDYPFSNYDDKLAVLAISNKLLDFDVPTVYLRPKNLILGIGTKRGKTCEEIERAVNMLFFDKKLSMHSIKLISSIDKKKDEEGIIQFANKIDREFITLSKEELLKVAGDFKTSEFVEKTVGVGSVSSRAAMYFGHRLLVDKYVSDGITLSISEIDRGE